MFTNQSSLPDGHEVIDMNDAPNIRSAIGFFEELFRGCESPNVAVRFWDGSVWRLRSA